MDNAFRDITHSVNNVNASSHLFRQPTKVKQVQVVRRLDYEDETNSAGLDDDEYLSTLSNNNEGLTFESTIPAMEPESNTNERVLANEEHDGLQSCESDSDEDELRPSAYQTIPRTNSVTEVEQASIRALTHKWEAREADLLDFNLFAALPPLAQAVFLNQFEKRHHVLNESDFIEYEEYYAQKLFEAANKQSTMSIYLQHLHPSAVQIKGDDSFGRDFARNISWMSDKHYYGPRPYVLEEADSQFTTSLDIDFTGFVTEAISFFKHMYVILVPDASPAGRMKSCKMKWARKALHTHANTALGNVDDKYSVHVVFPQHSLYDTEVIRHFYENVILPGIHTSTQKRVNPSVPDFNLMRNSKKLREGHVFEEEALESIQLKLEQYVQNYPENKPVFVVQYYGRKDQVKDVNELRHLLTEIERRFKMSYVYAHTKGLKTMFYQDVALDISCTDNKNVTLFWNKAIYQALQSPFDSPLAAIMRRNITEFSHDVASDYTEDFKYPQVMEYPNYGIGSLSSIIIEWGREHLLISKIKGYQKGSEEFRYAVPFTDCNHALLAYPLDYAKSLLTVDSMKAKCEALIKRLTGEAEAVRSKVHLEKARALYNHLMSEKAYGPRLEITLQNPTADDVYETFNVLSQFGSDSICSFKAIMAAYQHNCCPFETLRLSPFQAIETSTVCSFVRNFTESIATSFYCLLDKVLANRSTYNEHWLRLLFLLQDQLAFLWTGSLQGLCHPTLFSRFEQKKAVLQYGHFYIPHMLAPNGLDPLTPNFQLHIPLPSRMQFADDLEYTLFTEEDVKDDVLVIGIPRRFINQLFPNDRVEMMALVEKIRMVLQPADGVVTANSRTVGASVAANLLNLFFRSLFAAAQISSSEAKKAFLAAMKNPSPVPLQDVLSLVPDAVVNVIGEKWTCSEFVEQVFPLEKMYEFKSATIEVSFNFKWHQVCGDIVKRMNEAHDEGRKQPIITKGQIQAKIKQLLQDMSLNWLPRINKSGFWGWKKGCATPVFNVVPVEVQQTEQQPMLWVNNGVVQRISVAIDMEQKLAVLKYRVFQSSRFIGAKLKGELYRQCQFLLLKENPEERHKVKNVSNAQILRTGLFKQVVKRGPIVPCEDEVWQVYFDAYLVKNDPSFEFFAYTVPEKKAKYDN